MSGNVDFSPTKFVTLAHYIADRCAESAPRVATIMFLSDLEAYRKLGRSITGATWIKGERYPECREVGYGWFEGLIRSRLPWWARAAGKVIAAYAFLSSVRSA